jgi:stage II sporulation protein P
MVIIMGRFKGKKNHSNIIIYFGFFLISSALTICYLNTFKMINTNSIIDIALGKSTWELNDIVEPQFLLKYILDINLKKAKPVTYIANNNQKLEVNNKTLKEEPLVYIYNTHQEEKYSGQLYESYNIKTTVLTASKILKEYLEDLGIKTIVEEDSVASKLHSLNWKYGYSYRISRMFMEDASKKYPSLKYFVDLHRDSSKYEKTTTTINNEKYARLLFVVGLDNSHYEPNLKLAKRMQDLINEYDKTLCRGIMKKSGLRVNGIYNQDFSERTMLVEVGGQYNSIEEVNNTLKVLANILYRYIEEDMNGKKEK